MKNKIWMLVLVTLLISANSYAAGKIDPMFSHIRLLKGRNVPQADTFAKFAALKVSINGQTLVGCIIKANNIDKVTKEIEALGGSVRTKFNTVLTADVPLDSIEKIAAIEEVVYIEAAKKVSQKMNYARTPTYVVDVQQGGGGLEKAYTGSGSIVGVVDSGVDCTHPDFTGRISSYWDMNTDKKYTAAEIAAGDCYNSIGTGAYHGTHVAGIAAGANSTYTGVAPAASIAVVQTASSATTDDILDAVDYVFEQAQAASSPAVVNLSVGTSLGPHDGTSPFETGIDEAVGSNQGRVAVCAAGNETVNPKDSEAGYTLGGLHAAVSVSSADIGYQSIVRYSTNALTNVMANGLTFDIWLAQGGKCKVELVAYKDNDGSVAATSGAVAAGATGSGSVAGNFDLNVNFTDVPNAYNNKQHAQATVTFDSSSPNSPLDMTYDLVIRDNGGGCQGDAWMYVDQVAYNVFTSNKNGTSGGGVGDVAAYTYSLGDNNSMVTIPSTATGCISVASFAARGTWTGKDGEEHQDEYDSSIGATGTPASALSYYSSYGPGKGTSNVQKPDISAPGEPIISTLTASCGASCQSLFGGDAVVATDDIHFKIEGTSMSAPFVSGMAALFFERNGCLTGAEVKSALTGYAISDSYTGTVPNSLWGYGKVDALTAIKSIEVSDCRPSPASSGSGCSLIAEKVNVNPWALLLVALLAGLVFVRARVGAASVRR